MTIAGVTVTSPSNTVILQESTLGPFPFTVNDVNGYTSSPTTGTISAGHIQAITFTALPPGTIGFTESGLPSGVSWSVTVHGVLKSSVAPTSISFTEPMGTYAYTVSSSEFGSQTYAPVIASGATATGDTVAVTFTTLTAGAPTPASPSIDVGQSVTLSSAATFGALPYSYQWYSSSTGSGACSTGTLISGATGSTDAVSPTATSYYCYVVTDSSHPASVTGSAWDKVTVHADPTVSVAPTGPLAYDVGQTASVLTATVTYTGANTASVEWYSSTTASCSHSSTNTGHSGTTFTPSTTSAGTTYYCAVVSDSGVSGYTSASNAVKVTVTADPTVSVAPAGPLAYDVGQTASGLTATITYTGPNTASVEWYKSATSSCSHSSTNTGTSGTAFTPSTASAGTTYYCAVVSDSGVAGYTSASNAVKVTVTADPTVSVAPAGPLAYDVGQTAGALTATVTYTGPNTASVEWYSSATSTCSHSSTNTGTSGTVLTPSTASTGTTYYCAVVSDSGVAGYTSASNAVKVTITADPTVSVAPTGPFTYGVGQTASELTATVTYTGPNTASVEWYSSATSSCSHSSTNTGTSGTVFTPSTASAGTTYYCAVVSDSGVAGYTSASNAVEVTVTTLAITVTPGQGPIGATVTVAGTSFTASTLVGLVFDGVTISSCTSGSLTTSGTGTFSCTFKVPSGTSGTTVTATNMGGGTATGTFTVTTPAITVTPGEGPIGATVTVAGTGFSVSMPLTSLLFDGVTISSCTSGSLTTGGTGTFTCTFKVPSGTSGTTVTATDVGGKTATGSFTVTTPAITVTPGQGPIGASVTVAGTGFSVTSLVGLVLDGVTISSCTSGSLTTGGTGAFTCTFAVPSGTSGTTVTATDVGGQTAPGTFTVTTLAITVTPGQGPIGASVTVAGTGFSVSSLVGLVLDGVTISSCTSGSLTASGSGAFSCTFKVPSGTSGTTVTATDVGGHTATGSFTVTTLAITVTPGQGPKGATVTVAGTGFSVSMPLTSLVFDGVTISSCTSGSLTTGGTGAFTCTFVVPSGTSGTTVTATDVGGHTATGSFTVTAPAITVTPGQGPIGATVTVAGTGFSVSMPLTSLVFDGVTISSCTSGSLTTGGTGAFSCTFAVPSGTSGTTVTATDVGGQTGTGSFTVTTPMITVTPGQGPQGATVTVAGTGFSVSKTLTSLVFDGVTISSCTSGSLTTGGGGAFTCTFAVPAGTSGTTVTATDAGGQTATGSFTVTTPMITVTPGQGPQGASVTVAGTGFSVTKLVGLNLDGVTISTCTSGSLTTDGTGAFSCTFAVPSGTSGTTVTATDVGGQTATGSFTVTTLSITVTPGQGPIGATVTVAGTGFSLTSLVGLTLDGVTISSCTSGSLTTDGTGAFSCTFAVPSGTSGTTVTAMDVGGHSATGSFTVTTPAITVTPGQGPIGATVTVAGTGFSVSMPLTSLVLDGVTISSCTSGSLTTDGTGAFSCTFMVPSGTSGTTVTATDVGGQTATGSFTVTTPAITVMPGQGPIGATVTVAGTGFSVTSLVGLNFDGVTISSCTSGSLTTGGTGAFSCTFAVPSGTSGTTVTATDVGGQTATGSFTVTTPAITVTPGQGPIGATVSVAGTGFSVTSLVGLVFDGVTISSCTIGSLTTGGTGAFTCAFLVPSGTIGTTVTATDVGGQTGTGSFTVTTPAITVTPGQGPQGATVTVAGTGFSVTSLVGLVFDGVTISSCTSGSLTTGDTGAFTCTFLVPSGTGGTTVTATDVGGQTGTGSFTVTTPMITVTPSEGPVGTSVTVAGTGFSVTSLVGLVFDGVTISSCTSGSLTTSGTGAFSCTFAVPSGTSGSTVTATDVGGQTGTGSFTVTTPVVTVTPSEGPVNTEVTVTATGLTPSTAYDLYLDTSPGTAVNYAVTCTTDGSGSLTGVTCQFAVPNGLSGTYTVDFFEDVSGNYIASASTQTFDVTTPVVTVSPVSGPVNTEVTVTATGLTPSTAYDLYLDTSPGTAVNYAVSCTTDGSGSLTGVTCQFAVPNGLSGTYTVDFFEDVSGNYIASASTQTFDVTTPVVMVSPTSGPADPTITATGLAPDTLYDIYFDTSPGTAVTYAASCTTDGSGALSGESCEFTIPNVPSGMYYVDLFEDASGNFIASASSEFTVTTLSITVTPGQGPIGAAVTVAGTGFTPTSLVGLDFDGVTISSCTSGSLTSSGTGTFTCTFLVPSGTSGTTVTATDITDQTAAGSFTVTTPAITVTPGQGPQGATVTVAGTGFSVTMALTSLVFDGVTISSCTSGSLTTGDTGAFTCTFLVPSGTGGSTVTATDVGGQTGTGSFTVTTPMITVTPSEGPVGTSVTVAGTGFSVTSLVGLVFDGVTISSCTSGSLTTSGTGGFTCTFAVPDAPLGTTVTATDVGGQTGTGSFTVTTPAVTVTPSKGPVNTEVTVTATGLTPSTAYDLYLDTSPGTAVNYAVTCTTDGSGSLTGVTCQFAVPSGLSGTYTVDFFEDVSGNYIASASTQTFDVTTPVVTVSPVSGPVNTEVTVTATGLAPSTAYDLYLDTTPGTAVNYAVTCTTDGSGALTGVTCQFAVPNGLSGTYTVDFFEDVSGNYIASASTQTFDVTTASVTVSPTSGPSDPTITATGLAPDTLYDIYFDENPGMNTVAYAGSCTTDGSGALSGEACEFSVPAVSSGMYYVDLYEDASGNFIASASSEFTVTTLAITVTPGQGPIGATVTVAGTGFTPTSLVGLDFDGVTISSCTSGSLTASGTGTFSCTFLVPSGTSGTTVTATDITDQTAAGSFTVTTPAITVTPGQGPQGATVTVAGTGFSVTSLVGLVFDGVTISSCTSGSLTTGDTGAFTCTFLVPSGTGGSTVTATDVGGQTGTGSFTVTTPMITVTPSEGPVGTSVTVVGTGFSVTSLVGLVFDGVTISSCTSGSLTTSGTGAFSCTFAVPSGTSGSTVTATDVGGQTGTGSFTVTTPAVTVTPSKGPVNTEVTVTATGLAPSTAYDLYLDTSPGTAVNYAVTCTTDGSGSLTGVTCQFAVPSGLSGTYTVDFFEDVSGNYIASASTQTFDVTTPVVTVSPVSGPVNTEVTVTATGLAPSTAYDLYLDTSPGTAVNYAGSCTTDGSGSLTGVTCQFAVPSGLSGTYTVDFFEHVSGNYIASASTQTFDVTTASVMVSPISGPVNTEVTLTATGLAPSTLYDIFFDTNPGANTVAYAASCTTDGSGALSGDACQFAVPAVPGGMYYVDLYEDASGNFIASASSEFTVTALSITVTPGQGPIGATVTVAGAGFTATSLVGLDFDGVTISSCTSGSLTSSGTGTFSCTFLVPSGTSGTTVTATDITEQTATGSFTVTTPAITVTPGQGPQGATVTVAGTGFSVSMALTSLIFDGVTISSCTSGSLTTGDTGAFTCTFLVPSGTGGSTVTATDVGGQTGTGSFTVTTPMITVTPSEGPVGTSVTVVGTGFSVTSLVGLVFDGVTISSCTSGSLTTSGTGAFSCTFAVPSGTSGSTVTATDVGGQTGTGSFTVTTPVVTLTPSEGPVNTEVTVTATGLTPSTAYDLYLDTSPGTAVNYAVTCTTDGSGSLTGVTCQFAVPNGLSGTYTVDFFEDVSGNYIASASTQTFDVTTPVVTVSPVSGPVNTEVTVTATGLTPSTVYDIYLDTTPGTAVNYAVTCTTDGSGALTGVTCQFAVPNGLSGTYTVDFFEDVSGNYIASASTQTFDVTTASVTVSPTSGPSDPTITATGLAPDTLYDIYFDTNPGTDTVAYAGSCTTDGSGALSGEACEFSVPAVSSGMYYVDLYEDASGNFIASASSEFTVTTLSITVTPGQGPVGTSVTVAGTGFTPTSLVGLDFDGVTISSCTSGSLTTSGAGTFSCTFAVPSGTSGTTVTATDIGGQPTTGSFTVTTPVVAVSPVSGPVNTEVTVTATGLALSAEYKLYLDTSPGTPVQYAVSCTTDGSGALTGVTCQFAVPNGLSGTYTVDFFEEVSGNYIASASTQTFDVTTPVVTVSPVSGPVNTEVTVTATGLAPTTAYDLYLDTTPGTATNYATTCTTDGSGSLTGVTCQFAVPGGLSGMYTVDFFEDVSGNYIASASTQTFDVTTPVVTVSPVSGPVNTEVTVTATGLAPSTAYDLYLDTTPGTAVNYAVTCTTDGSGSLTGVTCQFPVPNGLSGTYTVDFFEDVSGNYIASASTQTFDVTAPVVMVSPTSGPADPTITATGLAPDTLYDIFFDTNPGANTVVYAGSCTTDGSGALSGEACEFTVPSVPTGMYYVDLYEDASGNFIASASSEFTVTALAITVTPGQGPIGATVTVAGTGFSLTSLVGLVFDGVTVSSCTSGSLTTDGTGAFSCTFLVPIGTSGTTVTATDVTEQTATGSFTVTTPAITVTPGQGPQGATVTVAGTGFSVSLTLASLVLDGVTISSCTSGSLTTGGTGAFSCTFAVPSETSGTTVTATDVGGQTATGSFTVTTLAITVAPGQGPQGATVTVAGTGFSVTSLVGLVFDTVTISSCTSGSLTTGGTGAFTCTFAVPSETSGTVVTATDVGGQTATGSFTVTTPAITLTLSEGPVGTSVTVAGTGFSVTSLVGLNFDGVTISSCTSGSLTTSGTGAFSCTFAVPSGTSGTTVTATDVGGQTGTGSFTVTTPVVTVTPSKGPVNTEVTVTATGLAPGTVYDLYLDTSPGTAVNYVATCTTDGSGALTGVTCQFAVPNGLLGTYTVDFFEDVSGNYIASASTQTFDVTTPVVTVSPVSGPVNTEVTVTATGLAPSTAYDLYLDTSPGTAVNYAVTCTTDGSGALTGVTCQFAVANGLSGLYTVDFFEDVSGNYIASASTQTFDVTTPVVMVAPDSGSADPTITATGLAPSTLYDIVFDVNPGMNPAAFAATCMTDGTGALSGESCVFAVPAAPGGMYYVDLYEDASGNFIASASSQFTVLAAITSLGETAGYVGDVVSVTGTGFAASTTITFTFDGSSVSTTCATDSTGSFPGVTGDSCSFVVPASPAGDDGGNNVAATDTINTAYASFTVQAEVTFLSEYSGHVGDVVTVMGTGFAASTTITFTFDGSSVSTTCATDTTGSFPGVTDDACSFVVPASPAGDDAGDNFEATDEVNTAYASFTVEPFLSLNPSTSDIGSTVTATGTGFAAGQTITFELDSTPASVMGTCISDAVTGSFTCTVLIPSVPTGPQTMEAYDGFNMASATLTVNGALTAPSTPVPSGTMIDSDQVLTVTSTLAGDGTAPISWQWLIETNGDVIFVDATQCGSSATGSTSDVSDVVTCTIPANTLTAGDSYNFELMVTDAVSQTATSGISVVVTVNSALGTPTIESVTTPVDAGQSTETVVATVVTGGTGTIMYALWASSTGVGGPYVLTGATCSVGVTVSCSYVAPSAGTYYYEVYATDSALPPATTTSGASSPVTVNTALGMPGTPSGTTPIDVGQTETVTSAVSGVDGTGSGTITYNLMSSMAPYTTWTSTGATCIDNSGSLTCTYLPTVGTYEYEVYATDSASTPITTMGAASSAVTVYAALVANQITPLSPTIDSGQSILLTANPQYGTTSYTDTWYAVVSETEPGACGGAPVTTGSWYTPSPTSDTWYCYVATDTSVGSPPASASSAWNEVTVNAAPIAGPATQQDGSGSTLYVAVTGGTGTFTYEWWVSLTGLGACTSGAWTDTEGTGSTYPTPTGDSFYCYVVTDTGTSPGATPTIVVDSSSYGPAVPRLDSLTTPALTLSGSSGFPGLPLVTIFFLLAALAFVAALGASRVLPRRPRRRSGDGR